MSEQNNFDVIVVGAGNAAMSAVFTFGGLGINENAQVVDPLDRALPGLHATGEVTGGFFHYNYPGGAGLMRGAVFGKRAGAHAAIFVQS